jgi:prepilin-type processing-associated H-X9-DG protein
MDGTSNQIIFGEKHIPIGKIGICTSSGLTDLGDIQDCSYLVTGNRRVSGSAAKFYVDASTVIGINRPTDSNSDSRTGIYGFGSYHSGVCQFLFGDGAVRAISVTTSTQPLVNLSQVDDGQSISIF